MFFYLFCLLYVANRSCCEDNKNHGNKADRSSDFVMKEISPVDNGLYSPCKKPPSGAIPVPCIKLSINPATNISIHNKTGPDYNDEDIDKQNIIPVYDRQIINTEEEYIRIFGEPSDSIDWKKKRILVCHQIHCYRGNELEYESYLSGIYAYGEYLYIGTTTVHHGPCQGIRQDMSWFSLRFTTFFLLVPRIPEKVIYYHCSIGGCPPDIP